MDRSLGFASTATYLRPIQTRFRCGSGAEHLNLHVTSNSLAHYAKGTQSPRKGAPTACKRMVSGSISLPFRGAFHLSLTVLVHYRSQTSI
jgi:hypothetical protein